MLLTRCRTREQHAKVWLVLTAAPTEYDGQDLTREGRRSWQRLYGTTGRPVDLFVPPGCPDVASGLAAWADSAV
jgi:hypothetical protein